MLIVILCALGTLAIISTVSMMALFIHSGNLSRAEEEHERKEKMNNSQTILEKTENKDNE